MLASSSRGQPGRAVRGGAWLWSAPRDLALFGGSAAFALALIAIGHGFGFAGGALPEWGFLLFVLGVDVAHVHATLFRTYFDRRELAARPLRYVGIPLVSYALGVALYAHGALVFWRALAYLALLHFVRQEIGWLRLYRARAREQSPWDARLDECAVYAATGYPLAYWHSAPGERHFAWFVSGDFVALPLMRALPALGWLTLATLLGFAVRQVWLGLARGVLRAGPSLIVLKTALVWYVGIVLTNSDFDFTLSNVLVHGVPYFALLWTYARERAALGPRSFAGTLTAAGVGGFLTLLVGLAFIEELGWDRLVWHEHAWLFGVGREQRERVLGWVVPLLAVPQVSHYLLDGLLWRRAETARLPAQQRALGLDRRADVEAALPSSVAGAL